MPPTPTPYQPGDVVQLKSGGPFLTVFETHAERDQVNCYYFTADQELRQALDVATVALRKPKAKQTHASRPLQHEATLWT